MGEECKNCGFEVTDCICGATDRDLMIKLLQKTSKVLGYVRPQTAFPCSGPAPNSVAEIRLAMEERSYLSGHDTTALNVVDLGDIKEILALVKDGKLPTIKEKE